MRTHRGWKETKKRAAEAGEREEKRSKEGGKRMIKGEWRMGFQRKPRKVGEKKRWKLLFFLCFLEEMTFGRLKSTHMMREGE